MELIKTATMSSVCVTYNALLAYGVSHTYFGFGTSPSVAFEGDGYLDGKAADTAFRAILKRRGSHTPPTF